MDATSAPSASLREQPEPDFQPSLRALGIRLETAAATANGHAGRGDAAELDHALEAFLLERDAFRAALAAEVGIDAAILERWLAL